MTTYPSSSLSPTPALTDEATLEAALECLLEHLPLVPEDSSCSAETLFEILLRAASGHDSIEHTAQRLQGVPSGNGIRYHLDKLYYGHAGKTTECGLAKPDSCQSAQRQASHCH